MSRSNEKGRASGAPSFVAVLCALGAVGCGDQESGATGGGGGGGSTSTVGGPGVSSGSSGATTSGSSGGCVSECVEVSGTFNGESFAFSCSYPPNAIAGADAKVFTDVGGEPTMQFICHEPISDAYILTLSFKGPAGMTSTGGDVYPNYALLQPPIQQHLDSRETNVTSWAFDITTFDGVGKETSGTFDVVLADDGDMGLAQYTGFGSMTGSWHGTFGP